MSNDKKTQRCMCVTIDFEQLTFGELRKFVELTADREDDEFVCVNDNDGVPDGFMAYVDAETIDVVPTDETSERWYRPHLFLSHPVAGGFFVCLLHISLSQCVVT